MNVEGEPILAIVSLRVNWSRRCHWESRGKHVTNENAGPKPRKSNKNIPISLHVNPTRITFGFRNFQRDQMVKVRLNCSSSTITLCFRDVLFSSGTGRPREPRVIQAHRSGISTHARNPGRAPLELIDTCGRKSSTFIIRYMKPALTIERTSIYSG